MTNAYGGFREALRESHVAAATIAVLLFLTITAFLDALWIPAYPVIEMNLLPSQHQLGDGLELHVGGAFVDFSDLGISEVLLDGIVFGEAVAAVNF